MVASMNITVRGLELLSGSGGGDYSLVVHETASRVDFERGKPVPIIGSAALY